LYYNVEGIGNTAVGYSALFSNGGNANTAIGYQALYNNIGTIGTGFSNTATGDQTLFSNTTGDSNTASGELALYSNTSGGGNVASGFQALYNNTTGYGNIALGYSAGRNLTAGNSNIDIGNDGVEGDDRTIRIGEQGLQTATYIAGISAVAVAGDPVVVDSNGQLGIGTSSKRFKDEIKPMGDSSEAVL